jgi:hypothetical protein
MPDQVERIQRIKEVKLLHQEMLMAKANVVGVAIGIARREERITEQLGLVVMVSRKLPLEKLDEKDIVPRELEGIPVAVQEIGKIRALD